MKELIFKYFDESCYGELISSEETDYFKPHNNNHPFGYSTNTQYLFYNGNLRDTIVSMFDVTIATFRRYFTEWFESRYNLPVSYIV